MMIRDCERFGLNIVIIGWGEPWTGFFGKLRAVEKQIYKFEDDDIVIVIDAFDTRINYGMEYIQHIYNTHFSQVELIFSKSPKMVWETSMESSQRRA